MAAMGGKPGTGAPLAALQVGTSVDLLCNIYLSGLYDESNIDSFFLNLGCAASPGGS
jgi:hypothetical protein